MLITPDLSEAVEVSTEPIPAGVYKARIEEAVLKPTKSGDAHYIQWKLRIFGAEGELARFNNWVFTHRTMTTGKGAGMLKAFYLAATGEAMPAQFDATSLYGREVQASLVPGKNQDGTTSSWPEVKAVKAITH